MLKKIKENHNKRILNLILHGKINAGKTIKNIIYWLRETQRVAAQMLKDLDDDDEVYLATASYTIEH
jgi:hypothetical protein